MKRILSFLLPIILLNSFRTIAQTVPASGAVGAELGYTLLSVNGQEQLYKVTLSLFNCCYRSGSEPTVLIYKDNVLAFPTLRLVYDAALSNKNITPVCPNAKDSTNCTDIEFPIPGIKKFVYSATITITEAYNNWRFLFNGIADIGIPPFIGPRVQRGLLLNNVVTYYPAPWPDTGLYTQVHLEATLNNTSGPNSSPEFINPPVSFFCNHKAAAYDPMAIDADGDLLQFSLTPAKCVPTIPPFTVTDITYIPPFTAEQPLPALPGTFSFNTGNGKIGFIPNLALNCLVANKIEEYRDGVKVGSSMREMTFFIMSNCNNDPPLPRESEIRNAEVKVNTADELKLTVCEGQADSVTFFMESPDPNNDNTRITYNLLPAGASVTVQNNGSTNTKGRFSWSPYEATAGDHLFYISYTDDACPIEMSKTVLYNISVSEHPYQFTGYAESSCVNGADGLAWVVPQQGALGKDYNYKWVDAGGNVLRNSNSATGDTLRNLPPGDYKVHIRNATGCGKNVMITVAPLQLPAVTLPNDTTLCEGMPLAIGTLPEPGVNYSWNTGSSGCCLTISRPASYRLTAVNKCGSAAGEVRIDYIRCNYCIFVPSAFSPNGDGQNDRLIIKETCLIDKFKLQIFNRWGQLLFTSLSSAKTWDGTYQGLPVETGNYFYIIEATPSDRSQNKLLLKGGITVLH